MTRIGEKKRTKGKTSRNRRRAAYPWQALHEPEDFAVDPSQAGPKTVVVSCHYCGYSPSKVPEDGVCPKCGGRSWERFCLSDKLHPNGALTN